jgi:hypothetical protein
LTSTKDIAFGEVQSQMKKVAKAAWPLVCIPKEGGGLGVLNIQTHNEALLLKHLHKFFNKCSLPGFSWSGTSIIEMVHCQSLHYYVLFFPEVLHIS